MSDFLKLRESEVHPRMYELHKVFERLRVQLDIPKDTVFLDPPYFRNDNSRAGTHENRISFNVKFLHNISIQELERIMSHELQHVKNYQEYDGGGFGMQPKDENNPYLFIFHPDFIELYQRMKWYFDEMKSKYPFAKDIFLPSTWKERGSQTTHNYADPDEVLSLLRGYQMLLQQRDSGVTVKTEPFDFSDVFAAGANDLRFLDREYRRRLAKEVIEQRPEIFSEIKVRKIPFKERATT